MSNAVVHRVLKAALTVVVLAVAARYIQPGKIFSTLAAVRPASVGLALVLLVPNLYLQQLKWLLLLRRLDEHASPSGAWHSLLAGFPLGLATPGRWGELGRAIVLPDYPRLTIAALAAIDKFTNFVVVIVLGLSGALVLFGAGFLPALPISPLIASIIAILLLAGLLLAPAIVKKILIRRKPADQSSSLISTLKNFDRNFWLVIFALSFLFILTFCAQLLILVAGLYPVDVVNGLAAAASTFLTQSLLPFSIGDLGIRESAAAFFFSKIGVAPHAAFGAALLLFVINMLLPSIAGLFLLWKNPSKLQS